MRLPTLVINIECIAGSNCLIMNMVLKLCAEYENRWLPFAHSCPQEFAESLQHFTSVSDVVLSLSFLLW